VFTAERSVTFTDLQNEAASLLQNWWRTLSHGSAYVNPSCGGDDVNLPCFSHAQLHHCVDLSVSGFWDSIQSNALLVGLTRSPFDAVAERIKAALPNDPTFGDTEVTFSKAQVQPLLLLTAEICDKVCRDFFN